MFKWYHFDLQLEFLSIELAEKTFLLRHKLTNISVWAIFNVIIPQMIPKNLSQVLASSSLAGHD